jgi:Skp family chaperone for outer membrane proteins
MNRKFALLTALVAGLLPVAAISQVSPAPPQQAAPAPAASAAPTAPAEQPPVAPPPPSAYPAKIALIVFEQAVIATNEGQRALEEVQKKYEPKQKQYEAANAEIDSLKKQLQAAPATLPDEERASRLKTIDTKEKQLNRDIDDTRTAYQSDQQEAYAKIATKFDVVMKKYVADNGYTLLINAGGQESPVMWTSLSPNADVTLAVIAAYNAASGVSAPTPSAPSATRPKPATTKPATPGTSPHTTTPAKPPSQ